MQGKLNTHHPNKWTMILKRIIECFKMVFLVKGLIPFTEKTYCCWYL